MRQGYLSQYVKSEGGPFINTRPSPICFKIVHESSVPFVFI